MGKYERRLLGIATVKEVMKFSASLICNGKIQWVIPQEIEGGIRKIKVGDRGELFYVTSPSSRTLFFEPKK